MIKKPLLQKVSVKDVASAILEQSSKLNQQDMAKIQSNLVGWFTRHQRTLPWRKNYLPYHVWIAEVMLQQTQVATMIGYFERWMAKFPTVQSIVQAPLADLLTVWQGLGYYNRCQNIHKSAQIIMTQYQGELPKNRAELLKLPGIGEYTAGAISSIAFNQDEPIVDGNIKRVFSRVFGYAKDTENQEAWHFFNEKSRQLVQIGAPRMINQALMELGALLCLKTKPLCQKCPIKSLCHAYKQQKQSFFPLKKYRPKITCLPLQHYFLIVDNQWLLLAKNLNGWWKNMWWVPYCEKTKEQDLKNFLQQYYALKNNQVATAKTEAKHTVTRYKVHSTMELFFLSQSKSELMGKTQQKFGEQKWLLEWKAIDELDSIAMPAIGKQARLWLHEQFKQRNGLNKQAKQNFLQLIANPLPCHDK